METVGRNDSCPCGSGKKYKKCCGDVELDTSAVSYHHWRCVEGACTDVNMRFVQNYLTGSVLDQAWQDFGGEGLKPRDETHPLSDLFERWFFYDWKIHYDSRFSEFAGMTIARAALSLSKHYQTQEPRKVCDAVEQAPFSFYLVLKVVPQVCMHLRDLLRKKEIIIYDKRGSQEVALGLIFYGRVITLDEISFFMGFGGRPISATYANHFVQIRDKFLERFGGDHLSDSDMIQCEPDLRFRYFEFCRALDKPLQKKMFNTDGDPFEIQVLHYQVVSAAETFHALKDLQQKISWDDDDELLQDAEFHRDGSISKVGFSWLKAGNRANPSWQNTVLGEFEIDDTKLTVNVNSAKRAKRIQKEIAKRLGDKALLIKTEIENTEAMFKKAREMPEQDEAEKAEHKRFMELPEVQDQVKEMTKKHWASWMDHPIPALNNMTPRVASQDEVGKELLEALLMDYERHEKTSTNNLFSPNMGQLRKDLGVYRK